MTQKRGTPIKIFFWRKMFFSSENCKPSKFLRGKYFFQISWKRRMIRKKGTIRHERTMGCYGMMGREGTIWHEETIILKGKSDNLIGGDTPTWLGNQIWGDNWLWGNNWLWGDNWLWVDNLTWWDDRGLSYVRGQSGIKEWLAMKGWLDARGP